MANLFSRTKGGFAAMTDLPLALAAPGPIAAFDADRAGGPKTLEIRLIAGGAR